MQISNEEMETLNRATEILSKYAYRGSISQEQLDSFEKMVIAIIDGYVDESSFSISQKQYKKSKYPISEHKMRNDVIKRNIRREKKYGIEDLKLYGYYVGSSRFCVVGEIFSKAIKKEFCLKLAVYDSDGDIIDADENDHYGSDFVTSMIQPEVFYDGYPFKFSFWGVSIDKIEKISVIPEDK